MEVETVKNVNKIYLSGVNELLKIVLTPTNAQQTE